ncbi:unnamed protein product [Calicophoron daubneyi]|uniref:Uncharacterized protein n=1 Tax=Calicophoron daubneyi TaxID=300641 RepID=A0AAV2TQ75_CALDB
MDVVFASPTGLIKGFTTKNPIPQHLGYVKGTGISTVCWSSFQNSILMGTYDGSVISQDLAGSTSSIVSQSNGDRIAALLPIDDSIVCVRESGSIKVHGSSWADQKIEIKASGSTSSARLFGSRLATGGKNFNLHIWDLKNPETPIFVAKNCRPTTLDIQTPVWISDISFVPKCSGNILLTSSRYGELDLYDLRCGQRRPVSRNAWRMSRKYGKVKVGTGSHGAVLPDLAATRPVTRALAFDDAPGIGIRVVAGDNIGDLCFLDLRLPKERLFVPSNNDDHDDQSMTSPVLRKGMIKSHGSRAPAPPLSVKTLAEACGSITGLACGGANEANFPAATNSSRFDSQPLIIASSLDRYLRIYNRDTGERLAKLYTKIPITCFVIRDEADFEEIRSFSGSPVSSADVPTEDGNKTDMSSEEEEFDELWDQMEQIDDEHPSASSEVGVESKETVKRRRHN